MRSSLASLIVVVANNAATSNKTEAKINIVHAHIMGGYQVKRILLLALIGYGVWHYYGKAWLWLFWRGPLLMEMWSPWQ
jgi:hypothetical protein